MTEDQEREERLAYNVRHDTDTPIRMCSPTASVANALDCKYAPRDDGETATKPSDVSITFQLRPSFNPCGPGMQTTHSQMPAGRAPTVSDLDTRGGAPSVLLSRWFLDNCVTTSEEWADSPDVLRLRDILPCGKHDETPGNENQPNDGLYEIPSILFRQLQGLVLPPSTSHAVNPGTDEAANAGIRFAKNIVRVQPSLTTAVESTAPILRSVVRHFAKTIGAHLITLSRDDLEDLAENSWQLKQSDKAEGDSGDDPNDSSSDVSVDDYLDLLLERKHPVHFLPFQRTRLPPEQVWAPPREQENPSHDDGDKGPTEDDGSESETSEISDEQHLPQHSPFVKILTAPYVKGAPISNDVPLIVHLFIQRIDLDRSLKRDLNLAMLQCPIELPVLLVISTEPDYPCPSFRTRIERPPEPLFPGVARVTSYFGPVKSQSQEALILAEGRRELLARNIRALQRTIRKESKTGRAPGILTPYADWSFLDGSLSKEMLGKQTLNSENIAVLLQMIGTNLDSEQHIKESVLGMSIIAQFQDVWDDETGRRPPLPSQPAGPPSFPPRSVPPRGHPPGWAPPPAHPHAVPGGRRPAPPFVPRPVPRPMLSHLSFRLDPRYGDPKEEFGPIAEPKWRQPRSWANFPPAARKELEGLDMIPPHTSHKYYWEQQHLLRVVDPKDLTEEWADIAIHPDMESIARDVVRRHRLAGKAGSSYGVLKHRHAGSALIYGPPGTGKSQLARLLARESGSTVISVSPEDLEGRDDKGCSLRLVRGLVSLGAMLSPSVVLLNVASDGWKVLNTLVTEWYDVARSGTAPLLLIATSNPDDLEPAALCRISARIHMGLPSAEMRAKIFEIVLRDEVLDPDIDYVQLALMTRRFSGSDIRNLCVQAAVMCDEVEEENGSKRILSRDLFERALKSVSPTSHIRTVKPLRRFATEYDPLALESMEPWDDVKEDGGSSMDGDTCSVAANSMESVGPAESARQMTDLNTNVPVHDAGIWCQKQGVQPDRRPTTARLPTSWFTTGALTR
ncbi:mitochondrial aaa [Colletotrichum musicola]|uniref:Mitochondrial aaa n=1 Tax=Colletotrichum musicola TaxID=2175873 RepID=A0A8H6KFY7_9PEZI|nr:mitochondrial aaa [Colletotrichum musicola]